MSASPFDERLRARVVSHVRRFPRLALPLEDRRAAAVAVTFGPAGDGTTSLILTRRASDLPEHGGQWALPGGRIDPGETAPQAALRELAEEVGIALDRDCVMGLLDDFATRSGYVITPVVVWDEAGAQMRPNPGEVAAAYRIPAALLDPPDGPHLSRIPESDRPVLSLVYGDDFIHAPTAAVVHQAIEVAFHGKATRVAHYEQPVFAWR